MNLVVHLVALHFFSVEHSSQFFGHERHLPLFGSAVPKMYLVLQAEHLVLVQVLQLDGQALQALAST
jgi:hypothetical protein